MPSLTVNVDDELKARMEEHPEINWSEVTRQAITEKIEMLEVLDTISDESELTASDASEIADKINKRGWNDIEE